MSTVAEALRDALQELFLPIIAAAKYDSGWRGLLISLGHTEQVASDPGLHAALEQTATVIESMAGIDTGSLLSWDGLQHVIQIGSDANSAVRAFRQAASDPALANRIANLGEELIEQLVAQYLRNNHLVLFRVFSALTIITPAEFAPVEPAQFDGAAVTRLPWQQSRFRFERIPDLVSAPWRTLLESYFPNNLAGGADAHQSAALLFPQLGALADALRLWWRSDAVPASPAPPLEPPLPDDPALQLDHFAGAEETQPDVDVPVQPPPDLTEYYASTIPRFLFAVPRSDGGADPHFAMALLLSSAQHPDGVAGLIVTPVGSFNSTELRGSWQITITSNGQIPAFVAGPGGFSLAPSSGLTEGSVRVLLERVPEPGTSGPAFVFGSAEGTRLELGNLRLAVDLSYDAERTAASIGLAATSGALVLAPGDGDGFLSAVLPADGLRLDFDLGIELSSTHGLRLQGTAGLDATLPVGLSVRDVLTVPTIHLSLRAEESGLTAEVSASVGISIGPVHALVERVGIATAVTFPETGGNLGVANLDFRFKPPNGIGLVIDAPAVVGGGDLRFDPQKEEYSGILQLEVAETIAVKAIGLLTTRLPDGSKGFSLVVIMSAEGFAPIQLGFGFALTGIGGLLGVNRTVMVDVLRSGLKNGTLGSILFPADPIRNAPQIVSDLRAVFPPVKDRYVFGPMAIISWGTPTILRLEIGLLLELPEPVRLIILGRLQAVLPDERTALVQVRMDAIGVIDFNKGEVSLDATLYDSRILQFVLTGDMALRANWGAQPNFVLAIGGFNPRFPAPEGFPQLARLALSLADSDNPRLRFECYLALTSNTVQFGARLDFSYSAAGFTLAGFLGFDALFQFDPWFRFTADVGAMVALKRGRSVLMGLFLEMTLEGPSPWHVWGKATFKVFFFKVTIRFDHRFGQEAPPALPAPIDVLTLLAEALSDRRNWSSALPRGEHPIVSLQDSATTHASLRVHPLAELTVRQRVVPLNRLVTKFGNAPLAEGPIAFTVAASGIDNTPLHMPSTLVREAFALAQFQELSDEEKLTLPSFETYDAGLQFGVDEVAYQYEALLDTAIDYETLIIDPTRPAATVEQPYVLPQAVLDAVVSLGAAGQAVIRRGGSSRYRTPDLVA